jgi:hypothetical protein
MKRCLLVTQQEKLPSILRYKRALFHFLHMRLYAHTSTTAPLAQSVERFHGKEKVTGPIPVGGSKVK